jgi:YD repeat-containing protein
MPDDTTRQTDLTPSKTASMKAIASLAIVLALLMSTEGLAQSRTFYDADGMVTGRSTTGSNGATTFYDASGRRVGATRPQGR